MGKIFGTDGFRGEAGVSLTADHALRSDVFWDGIIMNCAEERERRLQPES